MKSRYAHGRQSQRVVGGEHAPVDDFSGKAIRPDRKGFDFHALDSGAQAAQQAGLQDYVAVAVGVLHDWKAWLWAG